jgi:hypothetical protein
MERINLSQAFTDWKSGGGTGSPLEIHGNDLAALRESWNTYTDRLAKDGALCALRYEFAPAYGEAMPGEGSRFGPLRDDRAFILATLGVTLECAFVPFSKSRNAGEKNPSLNWCVRLRLHGREVLATDYMQGSGHCPAYKSPTLFNSGKRDECATRKRIAFECETGKVSSVRLWGGESACMTTLDANKIEAPSVVDVLYSLMSDGGAIDCATFEDWADELGYDKDSRSAEATYRACLETGLKLRAAFGDKRMVELRELFDGMR